MQSAGGEDATVEAEVKLLISKGHEVDVLYFNNDQFKEGALSKTLGGLRSIYNKEARGKLRQQLKKFRPDIIHVHNFYFNASPSVFFEANRQNIPVIATLQNYRLVCVNGLLLRKQQVCELCVHSFFPLYGVKYRCHHNSILQSAVVGSIGSVHKFLGTWKKRVDKFIVPAEFIKMKLIHSSLHLPNDKITVKRNFIDDPGPVNVSGRKNFFLFVGRLSVEKGVDVLLKCFSLLSNEDLIIVGDGPDANALKERYAGLRNIHFAGHKNKSEVLDLMKACRALLFPSIWYEGLPVTIIESLATGTPVIASRLGAMEEMIRHNINGLLFERGNFEELRDAINFFNNQLNSGNVSFYEEARKTYMQYYHPEICYREVIAIYNELIESFAKPEKA